MNIPIEQALYQRSDYEDPQFRARSPGFQDDWLASAVELVVGFGNRPAGVKCPHAVFAQPLSKTHVAVVQVVDREIAGRSGLAFQVLAIPVRAYGGFLGDPFWVASRFDVDWQAEGVLPQLSIPAVTPARSVIDLQRVLKRVRGAPLAEDRDAEEQITIENAESPALLGGAQILVDGGRVVFERPRADTGLIQGLWTLLPNTTRSQLWPASFAFCNDLGFDALVVPSVHGPRYADYSDEEQAADYPEGRYEYQLQRAAEAGDQREVDALLNRRSSHEIWKLGVTLLVLVSVAAFVTNFFKLPPKPVQVEQKAALAAGAISVGDPWSALTRIGIGIEKWQAP